MRLNTRLAKVSQVFAARGRADPFHLIEVVPVGDDHAAGRAPGLYRSGSEGSLCGLFVYDPAEGEYAIPAGRLAPFGLVIVLGPEHIEPPLDLPRE